VSSVNNVVKLIAPAPLMACLLPMNAPDTVKSPCAATLAPVIDNAVVFPDFISRLPAELERIAKFVPSSFKYMSPAPASITTYPETSNDTLPVLAIVSVSSTMFPVPCVPIVKSAFEVSVDKLSVLNVVNSPSVACNSDAVTTPPAVGPSTKFVPAAGESVILPEVDDIALPSILMLSTFSCPDVVCVPVCVISVGNTKTPVPAGLIVMLWFEFDIQLSAFIEPSTVKSPATFAVPLTVVLPVVVMSAVVNVPETDALPVTAVVAPNAIVPVPPGLTVIFAFQLEEISESLKIKLSTVTFPVIVAPLIVGAVITLFVSVCEPDSVATVASIFNVTVWLPATDVKPVPPAMVNDCESKSIAPVPESPARSKSCAVTCEST